MVAKIYPYEKIGQATGLLEQGQFRTTIFEQMSALANQHKAINLGQGFPDTDGPQEIFEAAISAMHSGGNQYATIAGLPALRQTLAQHQQRFYGQIIDADRQVTVTAGASEALAASLAAFICPGDEVVVFEPFYDIYPAAIAQAGGRLRTVPLLAPSFEPDLDSLEEAFSEKTAAIILNDPHNPSGRIFSRSVKEKIVELADRFDALIIQDAVYEHIYFTQGFEPIFAIPGAAERTIYVSAISKTHSLTGWRVGWAIAPEKLTAALRLVKGYYSHSAAAPLQAGAAATLALPDSFYSDLRQRYRSQRDILVQGLSSTPFSLLEPEGTFFAVARVSDLLAEKGFTCASELAAALPQQAGVAVVPLAAFATEPFKEDMEAWIRFAFCKTPEVLNEAVAKLAAWAEN